MNVVRFNTAHMSVEEFEKAVGIVRKHLRASDLIAIVGKHSPSVGRANSFCLARLKELP